jgi:hypothetical protein
MAEAKTKPLFVHYFGQRNTGYNQTNVRSPDAEGGKLGQMQHQQLLMLLSTTKYHAVNLTSMPCATMSIILLPSQNAEEQASMMHACLPALSFPTSSPASLLLTALCERIEKLGY